MQQLIDLAWENRHNPTYLTNPQVIGTILGVLQDLDTGKWRICEKKNGEWHTHSWLKRAILLYFQVADTTVFSAAYTAFFDKIPLKCQAWSQQDFGDAKFRSVPGGVIRKGAFVGPGAVIMPSFINVGAYIGAGTLIDSGTTIGSCAQIGDNCHISEGVGIGGVLEPVHHQPVIIEEGCFIGADCHLAEGVIIEKGSVLGMGLCLSASTKIVHRDTGRVSYGRIPEFSVVVPGSLACADHVPGLHVQCAVIVKTVDQQTREKTALNQLLRDAESSVLS